MKCSYWVLMAFVLVTAVGCSRQQGASEREAELAAGKAIFEKHCVVCHGSDGKKLAGWREKSRQMTLAAVEKRIRNGGGVMPAFSGTLSDKEIATVATYAKSLAEK